MSASHDASRHEVPTEVNYTHGPNFSSWYHGPTLPGWAAHAERLGYTITRYVLAEGFPKQASGTSDLTAVCERHGIMLLPPDGEGNGAEAFDGDNHRYGVTEADAVCALLKARYRIGTVVKDEGQSDFAAVVALADRLRGAE